MKDNFISGNLMEKAYINGKLVIFIKESGEMA